MWVHSAAVEHPLCKRKVRGSNPLGSTKRGVAQFGSVPDLGSGGRRFKSCHPDQLPGRTRLMWAVRSPTKNENGRGKLLLKAVAA